MLRCALAALIAALASRSVLAAEDIDQLDAKTRIVTSAVLSVCRQPDTQGKQWSVTTHSDGSVGLNVKSLDSPLRFSAQEWSGVQRVLAPDQLEDNKSYRKCSTEVLSLFLSKIDLSSKEVEELSNKIACASATPELARLAVEAKHLHTVVEYFRCHPELVRDHEIHRDLGYLFGSAFPTDTQSLSDLRDIGIDFIEEFPEGAQFYATEKFQTPLGVALAMASGCPLDHWVCHASTAPDNSALHWILTHSAPGALTKLSNLGAGLTHTLTEATSGSPAGLLEGWARDVAAVGELRRAGLPLEASDAQAFRTAYQRWLILQWKSMPAAPGWCWYFPARDLLITRDPQPGWVAPLADLLKVVAPENPAERMRIQAAVAVGFADPRTKVLTELIGRCSRQLNDPYLSADLRLQGQQAVANLRASKLDLDRLLAQLNVGATPSRAP